LQHFGLTLASTVAQSYSDSGPKIYLACYNAAWTTEPTI